MTGLITTTKEILKLSGMLALMAGGLLIACIPLATVVMLFFWLIGG